MNFKNVVDNLNLLKLDKISNCLSEYVDKVNSEKIPFLDALYELTKLEIIDKEKHTVNWFSWNSGKLISLLPLVLKLLKIELVHISYLVMT